MMIRIKFKEPETLEWQSWVRDCEVATHELRKAYESKRPIEVTDLYKRKRIKAEVYLSKVGPFGGRCAYCESYIADFQHGDIEHFRPKKALTDENDVPVVVRTPDGEELKHPGYYWLAYKWSNLLPSCITCNQPGQEGIGKRNRFPLEGGKYAINEDEVAEERPLLFNPIDPNDEDPEEHFGVDLDSGLMTMKGGSMRANTCIKVFGLNIRDQLVNERKGAIEEVKAKYAGIIFGSREKAEACCKELDLMEQGYLSHALARRAQISEIKERRGTH
jgi:hypothetical protein